MGTINLSPAEIEKIVEEKIEKRTKSLDTKIDKIEKKLDTIISLLARSNLDHEGQFQDLERIIRNTEGADIPL